MKPGDKVRITSDVDALVNLGIPSGDARRIAGTIATIKTTTDGHSSSFVENIWSVYNALLTPMKKYTSIKPASREEHGAIIAYLTALGYEFGTGWDTPKHRPGRTVIWVRPDSKTICSADDGSPVGRDAVPFAEFAKNGPPEPPATVKLNDEYTAVVHPDHVKVGCQKIPFDAVRKLAAALP